MAADRKIAHNLLDMLFVFNIAYGTGSNLVEKYFTKHLK
jgi:hypothetical protein